MGNDLQQQNEKDLAELARIRREHRSMASGMAWQAAEIERLDKKIQRLQRKLERRSRFLASATIFSAICIVIIIALTVRGVA